MELATAMDGTVDGAGHSHGRDRGWSWPQPWTGPWMELTPAMELSHHGNILSAARKEPLADTGAVPAQLAKPVPLLGICP